MSGPTSFAGVCALARSLVVVAALVAGGCGDDDAAPRDAATTLRDGAVVDDGGAERPDAAALALDAATSPLDASHVPEICDGGVDDDGDMRVDCDDDDCWPDATCAAADASTVTPGLVACLDPIERSVVDEDAACAMVGMPMGSTYPTECAGEVDVTATIRFFCDDAMQVRVVRILERATLPRTTTMLGPRTFESEYYEYSNVLDYERLASGSGGRSGPGPLPLHDTRTATGVTVVTVRGVAPGETLERLLGVMRVHSIVNLDSPMSMDTREALRVGATVVSIPGG